MTLTIVKDNAIYNILKFLLYKKVQNAKSVICEPPETECVFVLMFSGAAQSALSRGLASLQTAVLLLRLVMIELNEAAQDDRFRGQYFI